MPLLPVTGDSAVQLHTSCLPLCLSQEGQGQQLQSDAGIKLSFVLWLLKSPLPLRTYARAHTHTHRERPPSFTSTTHLPVLKDVQSRWEPPRTQPASFAPLLLFSLPAVARVWDTCLLFVCSLKKTLNFSWYSSVTSGSNILHKLTDRSPTC